MSIPLPWEAGHRKWVAGAVDPEWGTVTEGHHADPVSVDCFWWTPSSDEPAQQGHSRVVADLVLVVDSTIQVDSTDLFEIGGKAWEVIGEVKDYNHGPFGFSPDRLVIECRRVTG